jgi:hypothetical protein
MHAASWVAVVLSVLCGTLSHAEGDAEQQQQGSPSSPGSASPAVAETAKLITEDALTVDPGKTEVEFGYSFLTTNRTFTDGNDLAHRTTLAGQVLSSNATHGFSLRDVLQDESKELADGLGNVTINAKWRFFESQGGGVAISWLPGFTAPFGSTDNSTKVAPGQDFWSLDNTLALTFVAERFNLNVDAGYALPIGEKRGDRRGSWIGDVAIGYQLTFWFQPEVEFNYSHDRVASPGGDSELFALTVGAILNLSSSLRLDLGVQQALYGRNTTC